MGKHKAHFNCTHPTQKVYIHTYFNDAVLLDSELDERIYVSTKNSMVTMCIRSLDVVGNY